jgi:fructokinase
MIGILGEALIDFIGGKGLDGNECYYPYSGGCALNAATAASRLGSSVIYIGKLSADMFGQKMQAHFTKNNVKLVAAFCGVAENSMIGFARLDSNGAASYVFYSQGTTPTVLTSEEIKAAIDSEPSLTFLHIGSVALALDTSGEQIRTAMHTLKKTPFIFMDPNVRPTVIADFDTYRERVLDVATLAQMIKLSHEDLELLYPGISEKEAVGSLLAGGTSHVVLTRGKDGLTWFAKSGFSTHVEAVDNPIVDTVGAGDTVSGAILTYLEENDLTDPNLITVDHAREALRFASVAASVTCSRKGCDPPLRHEVFV